MVLKLDRLIFKDLVEPQEFLEQKAILDLRVRRATKAIKVVKAYKVTKAIKVWLEEILLILNGLQTP